MFSKSNESPSARASCDQMIGRLLRLRDRHAVLARDELHVRHVAWAFGLGPWVELEGAPDQLDLARVSELLQRALQPALADVAPRARDIRPDFELQRGHDAEHKPDTSGCNWVRALGFRAQRKLLGCVDEQAKRRDGLADPAEAWLRAARACSSAGRALSTRRLPASVAATLRVVRASNTIRNWSSS